MILLIRIKSQKSDFQTARQSEIDLKMAYRSKYGNFNFVVEYPIWVSIKRTLTGKMAVNGQIFTYCPQFQENVQKPQNIADIRKRSDFEGFCRFK